MSKELEENYIQLNAQLNLFDENHQIQFDKDNEAARQYFLQHVNRETFYFNTLEEKISYLVENDYWSKEVIDQYSFSFIKDLFKKAYDYKHRFRTFLSAYKFYRSYALKTRDGKNYLERWEDRCVANGLFLGHGDDGLAKNITMAILKGEYQPATPTFSNAARSNGGKLISCYLMSMEDNLESIGRTLNSCMSMSKNGGGIGVSFSNLREQGAPLKGNKGASKGLIPPLKMFEQAVIFYIDQLGTRSGAMSATIHAMHPDVLTVLDAKKENADSTIRLKSLSIAVTIPDIIYDFAKKDKEFYFFSPYEIEKEYGETMDSFDFSSRYYELMSNSNISKSKKIKARDFFRELAITQFESGYPYILNIDTVNKELNVKGKVKMTNLCSEILIPQTHSTFNSDYTYSTVGRDVSCNLGSLNIDRVMEEGNVGKAVATAIQALTSVTDLSVDMPEAPTVSRSNNEFRPVGLGAMNLHGFLGKEHIYYGSEEALDFVNSFFSMIRFYSLTESNRIASTRGESFKGFEDSKYASGEFFDKYTNESFEPKTQVVKDLFTKYNIKVPTQIDWKYLKDNVMVDGLYHEMLHAIAPNGSIGYITNSSSGLQPIPAKIETRFEGKVGKVFFPAPNLDNDNMKYFEDAYEIDQKKIIDTYAAAQQHIDQGMSCVLFLKDTATTRDLNKLQAYAHHKGIKTLYYVRLQQSLIEGTQQEECVSCTL